MSIEIVKIRATIKTYGLSVSTPFIQSFNIRLSRGQLSSFDASLKVKGNDISESLTGGMVSFSAGVSSPSLIYTGIIKKATVSPCWDDPGYILLNISGTDILSQLQGKKFTRRCIASSATWVSITDVVRQGLRSGEFDYEVGPIHVGPGESIKKDSLIGSPLGAVATKTPGTPGTTNMVINYTHVPKTDDEVIA